MASEDITKLAESLAKTQVGGGQLSFKGKSLKLNTAEDGKSNRLVLWVLICMPFCTASYTYWSLPFNFMIYI